MLNIWWKLVFNQHFSVNRESSEHNSPSFIRISYVLKFLTYWNYQNSDFLQFTCTGISNISDLLEFPTYKNFWHIRILTYWNWCCIAILSEFQWAGISNISELSKFPTYWHFHCIGITGIPKFWCIGILTYKNFWYIWISDIVIAN